jgi:Zn-dependent protease
MDASFNSVNLIIFIGCLLLSVGIHEAMHAFTSHWLGDTTARDEGRLTINPLKHLDLFTSILLPIVLIVSGLPPFFAAKPVPFNPLRVKYDEFGAAMIGVAGPLTNLALAAVAALALRAGLGGSSDILFEILGTFLTLNVALFVFNMIPFPPLDGSRLVYAFAPEPLQKVMYQIEMGGFLSIFIFIMIFLSTGLGTLVVNINNDIIRFLVG